MKLDPITLRLFVAVMEESAIARAAAREHIAPSAASRRLAESLGGVLAGRCERVKYDAVVYHLPPQH